MLWPVIGETTFRFTLELTLLYMSSANPSGHMKSYLPHNSKTGTVTLNITEEYSALLTSWLMEALFEYK